MNSALRHAAPLLAGLLIAPPTYGATLEPTSVVTNDNPWHSGYPLVQLDAARPEHPALDIRVTTANIFQIQQGHDETIELDGEVQRGILRFRTPVFSTLDLTFESHYVRHDSGLWDSVIQDWHTFFHLPNGGRELRDRNRLLYRHTDSTGIHEGRPTSPGWHYFAIETGWQRGTPDRPQRVQVALSWARQDRSGLGASPWSLHGGWTQGWAAGPSLSTQAGVGISLFSPGGDAMETRRHPLRLQGRAAVAWHALPALVLTGQLDTHTPLYDSRMDALGNAPLILSLGARVPLGPVRIDMGFSEDLNPGASPDWSTWIGLRTIWR